MSLPTYDEAVEGSTQKKNSTNLTNVLKLSHSWLDLRSLASLCLVSKQWHRMFNPHIWSDLLGSAARTRRPVKTTAFLFKRLTWGEDTNESKRIRSLVFSLDYRKILRLRFQHPEAHDFESYSSYFTGDAIVNYVLPLLCNLRFVVLDGLPGAAGGLPWIDDTVESTNPSNRILTLLAGGARLEVPLLNFRGWVLFSAPGCDGLDGARLLKSLVMPNLRYLDLSYTTCDEDWIRRFEPLRFPKLVVLKLAGLRLTDPSIPILIGELAHQLWSLDLRNNLLTNDVLEFLMDQLIHAAPKQLSAESNGTLELHLEDPPPYEGIISEQSERNQPIPLRPDSKDGFMKYVNDNGQFGSTGLLFDEHDPISRRTGLTHLYISGNKLTESGAQTLVSRSALLQVLDIGSFSMPLERLHTSILLKAYYQHGFPRLLQRQTNTRLESFRVHHSLVTGIPTIFANCDPDSYLLKKLALGEQNTWESEESEKFAPFDPRLNNRIHTLTLAAIPTLSIGSIIERLIAFIRICAVQEASLLKYRKIMPQGRRAAPFLPGLRILRLEFMSPGPDSMRGASVSEDHDADTFLAESVGDFSFFEEEKSEKGKETADDDDGKQPALFDVRDAIKAFRNGPELPRWGGVIEIIPPRPCPLHEGYGADVCRILHE